MIDATKTGGNRDDGAKADGVGDIDGLRAAEGGRVDIIETSINN